MRAGSVSTLRVFEQQVDIERLANPIPPGALTEAIEAEYDKVDDAAYRIAVQMALPGGPEYGVLVNRDQLDQVANDPDLRLNAVVIGVPKAGSIYDKEATQDKVQAEVGTSREGEHTDEGLGENPESAPVSSQDPPAA